MKLGVIGAGYVGLTTSVCLASIGHIIYIYDSNKIKIQQIKNHKTPFYEEGLDKLLEEVSSRDKLIVSEEINELIQNTDGCFICVGTPTVNDSIDLSQVVEASRSIASAIHKNKKNHYVIILRSTVIPNTTRNNVLPILNQILQNEKFGLCVVPEFLREGQALSDFMNPDKIVIGSIDEKSYQFVEKIFNHFKDKTKIIKTNPETAELIKYVNNAFFSLLISFSNEIANISEKIMGVDAYEVMNALILDKRITMKVNDMNVVPGLSTYLIPGCGFGGSCFPKDIKAIVNYTALEDINTPILNAILKINDERPNRIVRKAEFILGTLKGKQISILGLSFKPNTDDMRSSPSLEAIKIFREKGAHVLSYDPKISHQNLSKDFKIDFPICKSLEECLKGSDLAIVFTAWPQFQLLDSYTLKKYMKNPVLIDGRGFLDRKKFEKNTYFKVGHTEL